MNSADQTRSINVESGGIKKDIILIHFRSDTEALSINLGNILQQHKK